MWSLNRTELVDFVLDGMHPLEYQHTADRAGQNNTRQHDNKLTCCCPVSALLYSQYPRHRTERGKHRSLLVPLKILYGRCRVVKVRNQMRTESVRFDCLAVEEVLISSLSNRVIE